MLLFDEKIQESKNCNKNVFIFFVVKRKMKKIIVFVYATNAEAVDDSYRQFGARTLLVLK